MLMVLIVFWVFWVFEQTMMKMLVSRHHFVDALSRDITTFVPTPNSACSGLILGVLIAEYSDLHRLKLPFLFLCTNFHGTWLCLVFGFTSFLWIKLQQLDMMHATIVFIL